MKSPNETNLDEWLFHYFEGDLVPEDENLLEEFLLENPQFDAQFEAWGASRIQQEAFVYPQQSNLKKPIISLGFLHKAAVFTAIAINVTLASLIIFGDKQPTEQFAKNELVDKVSSSATKENSSDDIVSTVNSAQTNSNVALVSKNESSVANRSSAIKKNAISNAKQSSFKTKPVYSSRALLTNNSSEPNHSSTDSNPSEFTSELIEITNAQNAETWTGNNSVISNETSTNNSTSRKENRIESNYINDELNKDLVNDLHRSDLSEAKDGKAKESNNKDSKSGSSVNRIRPGQLLLSNTRDNDYLVPAMNRNQINFGNVGSDFSNSVYTNSYLQYPSKENQLFTNQLGYDCFIPSLKTGLGIQMMYSNYADGSIRDLETALTYSPKFIIGKGMTLEPAMRLRMSTTGLNRNMLQPNTWVEFDRNNSFQYSQQQHDAFVSRSIQQDLGLGMLLNTRWGYAGINADNLFGTNNYALHYPNNGELNRNPIFLNAVVGTEFESLNKKTFLSTQIIYQNYGVMNKIWVGSRIKHKYLSLGASVSSMGEPMFSAGYVSKGLSVFYSGDYSQSRMYNKKLLSHQLTMRLTLKESRMKKLLLN